MKLKNTTVQTTHHAAAREAAIVQNLHLVYQTARRLQHRLPPCVTFDDLTSAGTIGLIQAVDRFSGARGVQFKSYAQHRIHGAMLDYLRSEDPLSRTRRRRIRESDVATMPVTVSLNQLTEEGARRFIQSMEPTHSEWADMATAQSARQSLTARENRLVTLLFDLGCRSREAAVQLNVHESRVSQIKQTALAKLRRAFETGPAARAA